MKPKISRLPRKPRKSPELDTIIVKGAREHNLQNIDLELPKQKKHTIDVVVDRLVIKPGDAFRNRLTDSVELAPKTGQGRLVLHTTGREDLKMSEARSCCGIAYPELEPALFSFNSPQGMCAGCNGISSRLTMDPDKLVPDNRLTIHEGAVVPWRNYFTNEGKAKNAWGGRQIEGLHHKWGLPYDKPWNKLSKKHRDLVLYGSNGREMVVSWNSEKIQGRFKTTWEGLVPAMMRRYRQTQSEHQKRYYAGFMSEKPCAACHGHRLKPEVLNVRLEGLSIMDLTAMAVGEAYDFIQKLPLTGNRKLIAEELVKEISFRLGFLINVGLDYLTLSRKGPTLSGGESQRIRLASQVGSELTGVLYILDDPSIGLHFLDIRMLLTVLQRLVASGNTVIIIEHNLDDIKTADWVIDLGPEGGSAGGRIVAEGTPESVTKVRKSYTGRYLKEIFTTAS